MHRLGHTFMYGNSLFREDYFTQVDMGLRVPSHQL